MPQRDLLFNPSRATISGKVDSAQEFSMEQGPYWMISERDMDLPRGRQ